MANKKIGIGLRVVYLLASVPLSVHGMTAGDIMDTLGLHSGTDVTRRIREKRPQGFAVRCDHKTNRYSVSIEERKRIKATDGFKAWRKSRA